MDIDTCTQCSVRACRGTGEGGKMKILCFEISFVGFRQSWLQTKNTFRLREWAWDIPEETVLCTTIETNRYLPTVMGETMAPPIRAYHFSECGDVERHITIEPIMEFDLERMIGLIRECKPKQVNIGADTGRNHLPEPPAGKVRELIAALSEFTTVHQKPNLARIFNDAKR